jgi:hypothetical protein
MTVKEIIEYIVAAEVVGDRKTGRPATFEEIDEHWRSGRWTTLTIMQWLEAARYKMGYYGTHTVVAKVTKAQLAVVDPVFDVKAVRFFDF